MGVRHLGMPGTLDATVTPQGVEDQFGDPGAPGSSYVVPGCLLAPQRMGTSNVNTHGAEFRAETTVSEWVLYAPIDYDFPLGATVEVDGIVARVSSPAERWARTGQAVPIRRVTG